jgi:formate hydrogenlyase subunit 6/NADH:ubiquinone oxidoreductase subunit I
MYPNEVSKPLLFKRSKGFISVNTYKCSLCSICAKECPSGAISIDYNNLALKVDYAKCMSCGSCTRMCPEEAIMFSKEFEGAAKKDDVFVYRFNIINVSGIKKDTK